MEFLGLHDKPVTLLILPL